MSKPSIGFIGLGLMGDAICQRLLDLEYNLNVLANRSRSKIEAAVNRGATEASSAKDLAEKSEILFLCMDTSESVEGRMYGDDGVIAGLSKGKIVIDLGTSLPGSTRKIGVALDEIGAHYMDAPMGRTPAHALEGKLNLMCAGSQAAYEKAKPTLLDIAENAFYLGALGSGHTIKLLNNFMGMNVANAMSEVFAMADVMGVEREQVYNVMAAGPLHSSMMDFVKMYAVDSDPSALEFAVKNAAKDVGYYQKMASDNGVESIMVKSVLDGLTTATEGGYGDKMVSQMYDFYSETYK